MCTQTGLIVPQRINIDKSHIAKLAICKTLMCVCVSWLPVDIICYIINVLLKLDTSCKVVGYLTDKEIDKSSTEL